MSKKAEPKNTPSLGEEWRQGDVILMADPLPYTYYNVSATGELQSIDDDVLGYAVVTQSCDLVQSNKPNVQFAMIRKAKDNNEYSSIKANRLPRYIALPAFKEQQLVVDLQNIMTAQKEVLPLFLGHKQSGLLSDFDRVPFANAIARNYGRPGLPNDFADAFLPVKNHLQSIRKNKDEEGEFFQKIDQIRVTAKPGWESPVINLTFHFYHGSVGRNFSAITNAWTDKFIASEKYPRPVFIASRLDQVSAKVYTDGEELDLEYMSPLTT